MTTSLLIVNPQDGAELGQIDLSAFVDADGLPEVSQIVRVGDRLYLSCQRLDRNGGWGPADVSYLIVVDLATDTLVDVDPDIEGRAGYRTERCQSQQHGCRSASRLPWG